MQPRYFPLNLYMPRKAFPSGDIELFFPPPHSQRVLHKIMVTVHLKKTTFELSRLGQHTIEVLEVATSVTPDNILMTLT